MTRAFSRSPLLSTRLALAIGVTLSLTGPAAPRAMAQSQNATPRTDTLPGRHQPRLVEPHLHLVVASGHAQEVVALTFDACMGKTDHRILSTLIEQQIPATIFVTARWIRSNPQSVALLLAHPDLFDVENHGANHIPAVDEPATIYGIAAAGSPQAVAEEVAGGAAAMIEAGFPPPHWFRGSTARYDRSAIQLIRSMGYQIAGYSINGDGGSLLGARETQKRIGRAKDGDVVIAHINQPSHAAGEGVVQAVIAMKQRRVKFVRLSDMPAEGDDETTPAGGR